MSFAASNTKIVFTQFPGGSVGAILSALIPAFESAGWTSPTPYLGGQSFTIQSPPGQYYLPSQNLGAKVRIFPDTSLGSIYVGIQMTSLDGTRLGFVHHLQAGAGRVFQVWANCCQFFISRPGIAEPTSGNALSSCAGGIPFIPANLLGTCGKDVGPILATEAWWSSGDEDSQNGTCWRFTYFCSPYSACYNGDLQLSSTYNTFTERSRLHLLPMAIAYPVGHTFGSLPRQRWFGGGSMFFDPLVSWGSGANYDNLALVRGQLWDSFIVSTEQELDLQTKISDLNYINYTQDTNTLRVNTATSLSRYMALFLLLGAQVNTNFAYMY